MTVLTLGEILLRLSPSGHERLVQADHFNVRYGGSEANVAVALSTYGVESGFATKLPKNPLGRAAVGHLRRYGVNTVPVTWGGERLGKYFLETGAAQRKSMVLYDRAGASITSLTPDELPLENLLGEAEWFHWSGITPALGETPHRTVQAACQAAQETNVTVSCDLNFRDKLWDGTEEAQRVMRPLMEHVDVCMSGRGDPFSVLGLEDPYTGPPSVEVNEEACAEVAHTMKSRFGFEVVALTLRESWSASMNGLSALLLDEAECQSCYRSQRYEMNLVDRVGGGDAFAAGLIYGLLEKNDSREALEFATAAACLKHTIPGDANLSTRGEVESLIGEADGGQVSR